MLHPDEMIIDNFAGGGGASTGIGLALGRSPDIAINHDPQAIAMHRANHPTTRHFCKSIYHVDPDDVVREYKRPIGFAWFSPDCTHHSKARGGKPRQKHIRDLAWVVVLWAQRAKPRVIIVENVEEFQDWGPLLEDGKPCPVQKGFEFQRWVKALRKEGYKVEWDELRACDYGAPTIRKRLFIVARRDGLPIVWPTHSHGPQMVLPYRTAAECIDWDIPCPSIFDRIRPLKENTLRRIARGVQRYVIDASSPFIVNITHSGTERVEPITEPLRTITGANRGEKALVVPTLAATFMGAASGPTYSQKARSITSPVNAITADARIGMVAAFLAQHNGGFYEGAGRSVEAPLSTTTARGTQQQLVSSHLVKLYGSCKDGRPVTEPLATITGQGGHIGEVRAFLLKYYGTDQDPRLESPLHTVTSKDRFGLVMVHGEPYMIVDIGMRMLTPRELYRAQGFPEDYVINPMFNGKPLTKTAQVHMCGNSVSPPPATALTAAQFPFIPAVMTEVL